MLQIENIYEEDYILEILIKKQLLKQYKKQKTNILNGVYVGNKLSFFKPKSDNIWYFRINKQFRAICERENNNLIVIDIDNHQNF